MEFRISALGPGIASREAPRLQRRGRRASWVSPGDVERRRRRGRLVVSPVRDGVLILGGNVRRALPSRVTGVAGSRGRSGRRAGVQ